MCLTLRANSLAPHNDSNVRYKIMKRRSKFRILPFGFKKYYSPVFYPEYGDYNEKDWMVAKNHDYTIDPKNFGFHVLVNLNEAASFLEHVFSFSRHFVLVKVEVKEFLRSGEYEFVYKGHGVSIDSETWRRMRILEILK